MPRVEGQYYLDVDSSGSCAGACLQQMQDGVLSVLEHASRTFNKAEKAYCTTRREMCALIFGLKHFRSYLLGQKFICRVDHQAISFYKGIQIQWASRPDIWTLLQNTTLRLFLDKGGTILIAIVLAESVHAKWREENHVNSATAE